MINTKTLACVYCEAEYTARRSTKKFCSDKCRVYHNRGLQNAENSPTIRRQNTEYFDRVNFALELYYKSSDKDEWLQAYIDNPTTKKIVCNPNLLRDKRTNIAKIAHQYTRMKYGVSIRDYYRCVI